MEQDQRSRHQKLSSCCKGQYLSEGEPLAKILLVDDDPNTLEALSVVLEDEGYRILMASNGEEALDQIKKEKPEVVLLDVRMPGMDGVEALRRTREASKTTSVIMMTAYVGMEGVVEAVRLGAYDYVSKPLDLERVKIAVKRAIEAQELTKEVRVLRSSMKDEYKLKSIVGRHPSMLEVYQTIGAVVDNKASVLITGETGTGKEMVARAIHFNSLVKDGPFVAIDCASLHPGVLESELFGHEQGAFTDAVAQKIGKLELANRGTLLLDEIGNLSLANQGKLLRFLQERNIERVGGTGSIDLDVRVIAATNTNLDKAVSEGSFREDLYYRLHVVTISLPPLRERRSDIPLLAEHFTRKYQPESDRKARFISPEAMDALMGYHWPGNVRELENTIRRAVITGKGDGIVVEDLPAGMRSPLPPSKKEGSLEEISLQQKVDSFEKQLIINALEKANWVQTKAARLLATTRGILRYKMKKHNVEKRYTEDSLQGQPSGNETDED